MNDSYTYSIISYKGYITVFVRIFFQFIQLILWDKYFTLIKSFCWFKSVQLSARCLILFKSLLVCISSNMINESLLLSRWHIYRSAHGIVSATLLKLLQGNIASIVGCMAVSFKADSFICAVLRQTTSSGILYGRWV